MFVVGRVESLFSIRTIRVYFSPMNQNRMAKALAHQKKEKLLGQRKVSRENLEPTTGQDTTTLFKVPQI